ncbi:MAG: hypothetical protein LBO07_00345 [Coriobacteriales bacterium]|jgi:hypothetical protein|nr:hypothetical protein [Coriobacteriales bacterium]
MLEIVAIIALSLANSKAAKARGRSGGVAVAYTIALWVGLEIVGSLIGGLFVSRSGEIYIIYAAAVLFAVIGAIISVVISRRGAVLENPVQLQAQPYYGAPQSQPVIPQQQYAPPAAQVAQPAQSKSCVHCGAPITEEGAFCTACGKQLVG